MRIFSVNTLWSLIDGRWNSRGEGGWKILQILIDRWAGLVGGVENFRNINSRGVGGIFQNLQNFPSCIFQPVHPKQVSPRLDNFSYHLARIF